MSKNVNSNNLSNSKCMICLSSFESERCQNPEYFNQVFNVLCRLLEIDLIETIEWNFNLHGIPFCEFCCSSVQKLKELNDQFEILQHQINQILAETKENILKSENDSNSINDLNLILLHRVNYLRCELFANSPCQNSSTEDVETFNFPSVETFLKVDIESNNGNEEIYLSFRDDDIDVESSCKVEDEGIGENDPLAAEAEDECNLDENFVNVESDQTSYEKLNKDPDSLFLDPNDYDSSFQSVTDNSSNTVTLTAVSGLQRKYRRQRNKNIPETKSKKVVNIREEPQSRTFYCHQCSRSFTKLDKLEDHVKTHAERPFKCEQCDRSYSQATSLYRHQQSHRDEKKYKCDDCDKRFTRGDYLVTHRRIHTGEKPYKCDLCTKSFGQRSQLKLHKSRHTGGEPYECDECCRHFRNRSLLTRHKMTHSAHSTQ